MRNAVEYHYFDQKTIRQHRERGVEPYPDGLEADGLEANGRTAILGARVRDDEVRKLLRKFKADVAMAALDPDEDRRAFRIEEAKSGAFNLNERIGEVVRTLDDEAGFSGDQDEEVAVRKSRVPDET